MAASCLTSSSNEVFSYVFNHIAGTDECVRTCSGYWNAFPNGMWVTDLPTNDYEALEVSRGARGVAKKNSNESEKELEKKVDVFDQLEAQWEDEEIKIQTSAELLKDAERNKEKHVDDLQEITGQRTGIKLFKAGEYFEPQSSPFDNFLTDQEVKKQHDGLGYVSDNSKVYQKSADKKNNQMPNQRFEEISDHGTESKLKLFKADDYFEPQPSPFDYILPLKKNKGSEIKLFKANDYFEPQPSPFDFILPIKKNKGSEIKLFKAEDYFDPQPSVFDDLSSNTEGMVGNWFGM